MTPEEICEYVRNTNISIFPHLVDEAIEREIIKRVKETIATSLEYKLNIADCEP